MPPLHSIMVLDVPILHTVVCAVCHPPSQHHKGVCAHPSVSPPGALTQSIPAAQPLFKQRLQTGRHWLQQPQMHQGLYLEKAKPSPCSVPCITFSPVVFHFCLLGVLPCPCHGHCGCASTVPGHGLSAHGLLGADEVTPKR